MPPPNAIRIFSGPILRRIEPLAVNVWLALDNPAKIDLIVKDGDNAVAGTSNELSYAIGKTLVVKLVTFQPIVALQTGKVYAYDLKNGNDSILTALLQDATTPLGYETGKLPSFVLPAADLKNLIVAHGSCRRMAGNGREALSNLDALLADKRTRPNERIQQLFLTGDQIYADDIPRFALWSITESAKTLINDKEDIPLPQITLDGETIPAKRIAPSDALPGLRHSLLTQYASMTTGDGESHLLTFGEFCTAYLHAWSPAIWQPDFLNAVTAMRDTPTPETVKKNWDKFQDLTHFTLTKVAQHECLDFFSDNDDEETVHAKAQLNNLRKLMRNEPDPQRRQVILDSFLPDAQTDKAEDDYFNRLKNGIASELRQVGDFLTTLLKVRRVLANTATYMIFDDHDVTDDWNISMKWKNEVYRNPLGKSIIRNALMAYALFQDLGNSPKEYQNTGSKKAELAQKIVGTEGYAQATNFSTFDTEPIDKILGLTNSDAKSEVNWHYLVESGSKVKTLFLDTRTRRGFTSLNSRAELLSKTAFNEQFEFPTTPQNDEVLFVVSACPVIGLSVFEELIYPIATSVKGFTGDKKSFAAGQIIFDNEAWYMNSEAFEELLKRLSIFKKVVLFSGDVHYGFTTFLDYWKKNETQPSRFVQLVSSPLKNLWKKNIRLFQSGFVQGIFSGFGGKVEKFGWTTPPSVSNTQVSVVNRRKLREIPAVLDNIGWQAGATVNPAVPDWRYRLQVAIDTTNALKFSDPNAPFDHTQTAQIKIVGQRFHEDFKKARSLRLLFNTHVCTVSFENDNLNHTFHFKTPDGQEVLKMLHIVPLTPTSTEDKKLPELIAATT